MSYLYQLSGSNFQTPLNASSSPSLDQITFRGLPNTSHINKHQASYGFENLRSTLNFLGTPMKCRVRCTDTPYRFRALPQIPVI